MSELSLEHVESDLALFRAITACRHELEFRIRVNESADQPCARHTIDMDAFASDPNPLATLRETFFRFVTDTVRSPQARLQARHEPLGRLPSERVEEIQRRNFGESFPKSRRIDFQFIRRFF